MNILAFFSVHNYFWKKLILIVFLHITHGTYRLCCLLAVSFAFVYHAQTDGAFHTHIKWREFVFYTLHGHFSTCFKAENAIILQKVRLPFLCGDNLKLKAVTFITWIQKEKKRLPLQMVRPHRKTQGLLISKMGKNKSPRTRKCASSQRKCWNAYTCDFITNSLESCNGKYVVVVHFGMWNIYGKHLFDLSVTNKHKTS